MLERRVRPRWSSSKRGRSAGWIGSAKQNRFYTQAPTLEHADKHGGIVFADDNKHKSKRKGAKRYHVAYSTDSMYAHVFGTKEL